MKDGLRHSGVPLGGLGTGSVEIRSDGLFHEWQIMNNAPWGPGPDTSPPLNTLFFGLQVHGACEKRTAILANPPPWDRRSMVNDPYAMPWLEHASSIEAKARFPFTDLTFDLGDLPVKAKLEAFSPFIPLDSKNSGLPVAYLTYSLRNTSRRPLKATLFGCLRNLAGYTSEDALSTIEARTDGSTPFLAYGREGVAADRSDAGSMVLGVAGGAGGTTSYAAHFRPRDLWEPLRETGILENRDLGSMEQELGNMGSSRRVNFRRGLPFGALARTMTLKPGRSADVTFVLAWHFPNLIEKDYVPKEVAGTNIGHRYEEWFGNATDVFTYAAERFESLRSETRAFVEAYYASSLPGWMLDAIAAQLTTLPKASWWDRTGRFGIWEGLGCCGLQTTDITHYGSFPIVQFFPDIQKSQMRLSKDNVEVKGKIPHLMPGTFSCCDVDHRSRIDLIPQFIMLVWRDVRWTGDLDYLREMWRTIKDSLAFFATKDTDGDGLPNNTGPDQTYDQFPLKGTSAFVGFLYLAALRATAEMASLMDEEDYEAEILERYMSASELLHEQLWNGRYFRLCHDPATGEGNEGVMADQLNADWFIRQTTGGALVDDRKVKSSLKAVLAACTDPTGYLANCAWPEGGAVEIGRHTADQANWPWSGVEYTVAAHLVLMGMEREGARVVRDVWDRYERMGLRFNHIECGGHYYRAMSSWAVYLAFGGYIVDVLSGTLSLRFRKEPTRVVLAAPTGWGILETKRAAGAAAITMKRGTLEVRGIEVMGLRFKTAKVNVGRRSVKSTCVKDSIKLADAVTLGEGDVLKLKLGGGKAAR